MRVRIAAGAVALLAVLTALTACTSSDTKGTARTSSAPTSAPAPDSSAAPTTSAPPTTAAPTTSAPVSPSATASPVQQRSTCTSLMIRILRGSAAVGRQFAAVQFINTGSSTCMLYGYPTVTLLRDGSQIGDASQPAGSALSSRRLAPGDTAESQVNDYVMNCTAAKSDTLRVVAPGSSQTSSRPVELRACKLRVAPLSAPA